ncbi:MAG: (d)CMP kinase [Candidatus Kerfeldbacteria bacterium]|nr:(d)CMP kinase [Candidatus Kerfeldbacteria bacterium]
MIITFGGTPGSGKGTVSKRLAKLLRYERLDIGELRRRKARKLGMTLEEYNRFGEYNFSTDHWVDEFQERQGKRKKNLIVDGRLSFHFIPKSLKIFLFVSSAVGAKRIWSDFRQPQRRNEAVKLTTVNRVKRSIIERMRSDRLRYRRLYGLNPFAKTHYDLYLDTTKLTPDQVLTQVKNFVVDKLRRNETRSSKQRK